MTRATPLLIALVLAGCGSSTPQEDMPARDWKYYVAHPDDIEPMQKICLQWAASKGPAVSEPVVVAGNCRAAAFAKSMLKSPSSGEK
jgi:hypothetical protein